MSLPACWIALAAFMALLAGLWLVLAGRGGGDAADSGHAGAWAIPAVRDARALRASGVEVGILGRINGIAEIGKMSYKAGSMVGFSQNRPLSRRTSKTTSNSTII
jgi:hypothetical protein